MKSKKGLIIGSIIAVIVIIVAIIGVLYFTTDLFKTDRQLFYKYLSKVQIMDKTFAQKYTQSNEKISKNSSSSVAEVNVSAKVANTETGIADVQKLFSIKSNGLENVPLKQSYRDFILSSNEQNLLTLKYMRDDNLYAIGADNILAKYIAVENANLKELFAKMGVEDVSQIPDSIPTNYEELLKIDEQTLQAIGQTYSTYIYNNINENSYYTITNSDKTKMIGVSLTEQEVITILKGILETAKNDNTLLSLIMNKAQLLGYKDVTVQSIQTQIQEYIDELSSQTYSNEKGFFEFSFTKSGNQIIKINITTIEKVTNENNVTETDPALLQNPIETIHQTSENKIRLEIDISQNGKMIMTIQENNKETMKIEIDYSYNDVILKLNIAANMKENDEISTVNLNGEMSNYQTENITQNYVLDITSGENNNYQITMSNQISLKEDVQIQKLTTENSAKLNDMSGQQISQLFTAIVARVMTLYGAQISSLSM